jgi:hypothetical protein
MPSRAIARKTRAPESMLTRSTEVMPATPAIATITSAHCIPTDEKAIETPAPVSI